MYRLKPLKELLKSAGLYSLIDEEPVKGDIFCNECKFLVPIPSCDNVYACNHPYNKDCIKTPLQLEFRYKNLYVDINKNNSCEWFKEIKKRKKK